MVHSIPADPPHVVRSARLPARRILAASPASTPPIPSSPSTSIMLHLELPLEAALHPISNPPPPPFFFFHPAFFFSSPPPPPAHQYQYLHYVTSTERGGCTSSFLSSFLDVFPLSPSSIPFTPGTTTSIILHLIMASFSFLSSFPSSFRPSPSFLPSIHPSIPSVSQSSPPHHPHHLISQSVSHPTHPVSQPPSQPLSSQPLSKSASQVPPFCYT